MRTYSATSNLVFPVYLPLVSRLCIIGDRGVTHFGKNWDLWNVWNACVCEHMEVFSKHSHHHRSSLD